MAQNTQESKKEKSGHSLHMPHITADKAVDSAKKFSHSYLFAILSAAIGALIVRIFLIEAFKVPTDFMSPALLPGDHIFVNKMAFRKFAIIGPTEDPKRGDVVIFSFETESGKDFIKRVIGVPGDTLEIRDGEVVLNGKALGKNETIEKNPALATNGEFFGRDETFVENLDGHNYKIQWSKDSQQPRKMSEAKIPNGAVFVLSDNRSKGQDSRNWGYVPIQRIKGKAVMVWYSSGKKENGTSGTRWSRIFKGID